MKRINIFLSITIVLFSLVAIQSCTQDDSPIPVIYKAAVPANPTPALNTPLLMTFALDSLKVTLKWDGTATVAPKWDVYLGMSSGSLVNIASQHSGNTLDTYVKVGGAYSWYVYTIDANKVYSKSATWNFSLVTPFRGTYLTDEPAEAYTYNVDFSKVDASTIQTTNYWNSGWTALFTLNFTTNTYSMPLTIWGNYSAEESGTIDPVTGKMVGNYSINHLRTGVWSVIETGVHTYTLQ